MTIYMKNTLLISSSCVLFISRNKKNLMIAVVFDENWWKKSPPRTSRKHFFLSFSQETLMKFGKNKRKSIEHPNQCIFSLNLNLNLIKPKFSLLFNLIRHDYIIITIEIFFLIFFQWCFKEFFYPIYIWIFYHHLMFRSF